MVFKPVSNEQNSDDTLLNVIGIVVIIAAAGFLFLSFLPSALLALLLMFLTVRFDKKHWLNYGVIISALVFIAMIYFGTWQEMVQFVSIPLSILPFKQVNTFLVEYINNGKEFTPTITTYVYTILLSILIARVLVYFNLRFQSRLVNSKKDEEREQKETAKYKKISENWININNRKQKSWRKKQAKKENTDDVFLGIDRLGENVHVTYKELKQHVLATGTTGSGKTTALYSMLETALVNKNGFVMIDGKGDPETIEQVQSLFSAYGRKLHVFHSSKNLTYNPFKNGGYTAATNHLFNALDWSEQFYKNTTKEHTQNVIAFIDEYGYTRDMKHISKFLELEQLLNILLKDTETYEKTEIQKVKIESKEDNEDKLGVLDNAEYEEQEVTVQYEALTERAKKHLQRFFGRDDIQEEDQEDVLKNANKELKKIIKGMTSQLNYLIESEIGYLFEEKEGGIDLAEIIKNGEGVIFSLNAMSYDDFIKRLGRFIIDDVSTIIQEIGQHEKNDVLAIFDEFDAYGNERITDILARSRSANFRAVISLQSLSQLSTMGGDITQKVIDTCNTYLFGMTNDPKNAEYLANLIGTREDEEQTFMTKDILTGMGRVDYKSDYGTTRRTRNYYFHPDIFKELDKGKFIIRRKAAGDKIEEKDKRSFIYFRNPVNDLKEAN